MKRFLLFQGDNYYPQGGWGDFRASYDTIAEAKTGSETGYLVDVSGSWAHVVDSKTGKIVSTADFPR